MNRATHRVWLIGMAITLFAVFAPAGSTARSPMITPNAIAGARLGLSANAYKHLLGEPYRFEAAKGGDFTLPGFQQPGDYTRIVFPKRKMDVYFAGGIDRAIQITTWNAAYKTAEGVGPCSSSSRLKAAYGHRVKPNPGNGGRPGDTNPESWTLGRSLVFFYSSTVNHRAPTSHMTAVSLYDGSEPGWNKPGGPLYVASFVGSPPDQVQAVCR